MTPKLRVLFIARYRDITMDRKLLLMAQEGDLLIRHVRPQEWHDELIRVEQATTASASLQHVAMPMMGPPSDPHRALYRSLDFGMHRFRPHLIHAEEEPDSLAALQIALARRLFAPRAPLLLHTWQNIDRPRRWPVRLVTWLTLRAADGVLCANREAAAILRRRAYPGLAPVLPAIGVDTQTFVPCPDRPRGPRFVVGYVGRLAAEKGIDTLIEAVRRLGPEVELTLIGAGPQQPVLEAQAADLAGRVQFHPPAPPAQIARLMCQFDTLALPSRTTPVWKEQFGRVLVEAMACQVPVVGSDSGAIPEVVGDAGLIFPEGDVATLAECLRRLMGSPALRLELAARGYARVQQRYTQEHIAAQTVALYRQMMRCTPATCPS